MSKKMLLFISCAIISLFVFVSCGTKSSSSANTEGKIRVAYITRAQADSFAAWLANSMKEEAAKYPNIVLDVFDGQANDDVENLIIKLAKNPKVVAVGEIGLDYYWDKSFADLQKEVFIKQVILANKLNLPIVVHDREAHKDTFDILKKYNEKSDVLFHCFSGSVEFMKECVKQGWYIALGGVVTFKNAVKIKDVAREVPLDRLVLETDSPYLTPVPYRGKENSPGRFRLF